MTPDEIINEIKVKPSVPVWPHIGFAYGVSRAKAYQVAQASLKEKTGEFIRIGKTIRAVSSVIRQKLGIS